MEKLKQAKHNHLLTDWLKVGIFALLLLLPFFVFAPTAFYYGFNEHATAPTKQVENTTTINMQQSVLNGKPIYDVDEDEYPYFINNAGIVNAYDDHIGLTQGNGNNNFNVQFITDLTFNLNDVVYACCNVWANYIDENETQISAYIYGTDDYFDDLLEISNVSHNQYFSIDTSIIANETDTILFEFYGSQNEQEYIFLCNVQLFNFTQMFGSGNEPTIDEFNTLFPNDYYDVNSQATTEWPNGTYTTYTDISSTMSFAWESMFDTPLLKWTKESPFKTSINGFLTLFQIPQQSGIGLYLNYLITMVCIYVVFDIVIQLFKWITHIIGEK